MRISLEFLSHVTQSFNFVDRDQTSGRLRILQISLVESFDPLTDITADISYYTYPIHVRFNVLLIITNII